MEKKEFEEIDDLLVTFRIFNIFIKIYSLL
jgi:hypothetical protein